MGPVFCVTSDIDWASEYCIREFRSLLEGYGVRPTIFATHRSVEVDSWKNAEVGIHPNFLSGSTHGNSVSDVIDHVMKIVPGARTFRSHCFFDNSHVTRALRDSGVMYDSNLCLHLQSDIVPLRHASGMLRFPVFFEDDFAWTNNFRWDTELDAFFTPGLKILNFHPFMVAINCPTAAFYAGARQYITTLDATSIESVRFRGLGEQVFLIRLLDAIASRGHKFHTLGELFENAKQ